MTSTVESEQEEDCRWLVEVLELPIVIDRMKDKRKSNMEFCAERIQK